MIRFLLMALGAYTLYRMYVPLESEPRLLNDRSTTQPQRSRPM